MSPTRLFYAGSLASETETTLDAAQSRYLSRALRLRVDDTLTLFDGRGGEYPAQIKTVDKNSVVVAIGQYLERDIESPLRIDLVQGISKGDRMDTVIQKATELGVARITPVITEYTVVKLGDDRARKRTEHWQKIAQSACEQCGRNRVPEIMEPQSLMAWFGEVCRSNDSRLILRPGAAATLADVAPENAAVMLLIGPEGGFSEMEYEKAAAAGLQEISLGPRVLRTETAAIAALAQAQSLWGDI